VNVAVGLATVWTMARPPALGLAIGSWVETAILTVILWRKVAGS
jgi:hypothetical protein